jgi:PAS domain S-box-containing protein
MRSVWAALMGFWSEMMGKRATRKSVRSQLMRVVALTTGSALLVAGSAMLWHDLLVYRLTWSSDLATQAGILSLATAPALAFDDHDMAQRNLDALQSRPRIQAAALYLPNGTLFAQFVRPGFEAPPATPSSRLDVPQISGERVELTQRIVRNGDWLGTIYLRARYDVSNRVITYLSVFTVVTGVSMLAALILSTALQRVITAPLEAMTRVARRIVHERDYSLRVPTSSEDEIGLVVSAFNNMLDEVHSRTQALEHANARLESSMSAAEIGSWVWDLREDVVTVDRNLAALYGIEDETALNADAAQRRQLIHPEDLNVASHTHDDTRRTGVLPSTQFRIVRPDGSERWVIRRGKVHFDADGTPILLAGLLIDVTAQKLAEEALREADRRKDEFLATLAHELRNPLAPIRNAARLLESPAADERQKQWARDVISRQVQRMALLLDDLLDVSRITSGRLHLRKEPVELLTLVTSAVETARPLIDAKHHQLEIVLPPEPIELQVDPLRLSQALSNLLTNAAKYTDPAGRIMLAATLDAQDLTLSVRDSGIGLSALAISRVFEMFSQVDSAVDRTEGGLGIGLALVKGLVILHGGSVGAASDGPGRGSTFTISLPRANVLAMRSQTLPVPSTDKLSADPRCRVLVADDNVDAGQTMALILKMSGYEVDLASSGREALEIARSRHPHALILDIGMPQMNGYELARHIRKETWGRKALLIAVTGWGQPDDKERARSAGFDQHLTKPVDLAQIERMLASFAAGGGTQVSRDEAVPGA